MWPLKHLIIITLLCTLSAACLPNTKVSSKRASSSTGSDDADDSDEDDTDIVEISSDPLSAYAWHLNNFGQSTFSTSSATSGEDSKINYVHSSGFKGAGIKIAISDSGTDIYHRDLISNAYSDGHRDYSSDDSSSWSFGNPFPIEYNAHGTAVTGLISATADNGIGSKGVAPEAEYSSFLFIGDFHDSDSSYEAKELDQMNGDFDIFNYSYGYVGCYFVPTTSSIESAYYSGVTTLRSGKGAIYVKAAGNDYVGANSDCYDGDTSYFYGNTNTSEDQNLPYPILAAAINAKGQIASYSTPGSGLWISAAGGEYGDESPAMLTTDISGCTYGFSNSSVTTNSFNRGNHSLNASCDYTSLMNGTSSAAPVLSGIIALILEANSDLTWRDVKHILALTADKINYSTAAISHPAGTSKALSGHVYDYRYVVNNAGYQFSNTYGFGRVNAYAAVQMAKSYTSSLGDYIESAWTSSSSSLSLSIPDASATGVSSSLMVNYNYRIESIQVNLSLTHPFMGDLGVELTSPHGTTSKLLLINSNMKESSLTNYTLLSNAFYGESSNGTWTLKVIDGASSNTGTLDSWKIKVNGAEI